ncbi:Na+/H+ antiporter NhaA [Candidatus Sulfidibacterium hydrothermale]|uniref:Na+/H+ antiporter NhaA n=1 Tax=Candidatus Sulfidibacterium hydrothermale TaxID=2875962 RepID=UPI001F0AA80C|nr:Na+/H+ antiporter NhaA [Candidatus Sulfidibacterium hydrothermale]UBM62609.1 Na+/H+ antiporter NhaA [Candidatus Sulfidibacterium hydrothermale]
MSEKPIRHFGITKFINQETAGGVLLILATIVALFWANSSYYPAYHHLWYELKAGITWGNFKLIGSLHHWINDGLMAIFFFTVGLEIKREIIGGELSSMKKATLPIVAAIGGMLVPALIYVLVVINKPELIHGWGIPMATDIAFALGLLAMLGKRVNIQLKIFLTALAIADDLGAILVIAIFYTDTIAVKELITAAVFLVVLIVANYAGVRRTLFYTVVGLSGVWLSFLYSGVHATIAGVLIALTIPARTKINEETYITKLEKLLKKFRNINPNNNPLLTEGQAHVIEEIDKVNDEAQTPLQKLEHFLHPITTYFILPLFALSNAGVRIEGNIFDLMFHPVSIAIILGLVIGKFAGITIFSKLMVKFKLAILPEGVTWKQFYGVAMLAGIGFTMSIFISELAFRDEALKQIAKVGIMTASLIAALVGMGWLAISTRKK